MIEAHNQTVQTFSTIRQNEELINVITTESFRNRFLAEAYTKRYEALYPDVSRGIRARRAEYFLLTHTFHYIEQLLHQGQIEDKDHGQLSDEIDKKIYFLKRNDVEVKVLDSHELILI